MEDKVIDIIAGEFRNAFDHTSIGEGFTNQKEVNQVKGTLLAIAECIGETLTKAHPEFDFNAFMSASVGKEFWEKIKDLPDMQ